MQAIVVEKLGGPEELQTQEWPVPSPAPVDLTSPAEVNEQQDWFVSSRESP